MDIFSLVSSIATAEGIAISIGVLFLLIVIYIAILAKPKQMKLLTRLPNTTAENIRYEMEHHVSKTKYGAFHEKYFGSKFANGQYLNTASKLGIDAAKLEQDIYAARLEDKITVEEITSMRILGYAGAGFFGFLYILTGMSATILILLAAICYLLGCFLPQRKITSTLQNRKEQIVLDLPGFIELVYSTLEAGSTIQEALTTIASKTKGPLAEEFLMVSARTKISGKWKQEMEYMGEKCGVEELNDLISDILISYEKGTSVVQVLKDDAEQLRAIKNAKINEKAKKLSISLLIPMAIFEFVPMFALMLAPMLVQFLENF